MNTDDLTWFHWLYMADEHDNTNRKKLAEMCAEETRNPDPEKIYDFSTACATIIGGGKKSLQKWLEFAENEECNVPRLTLTREDGFIVSGNGVSMRIDRTCDNFARELFDAFARTGFEVKGAEPAKNHECFFRLGREPGTTSYFTVKISGDFDYMARFPSCEEEQSSTAMMHAVARNLCAPQPEFVKTAPEAAQENTFRADASNRIIS